MPLHRTRALRGVVAQRGLSYVELLVAVVLLSLALVPFLETLATGVMGAGINKNHTVDQFSLLSKFEETLAQPFDALDAEAVATGNPSTATSLSDPVGTESRRLVFLSRYDGDDADTDGDPFTGVDEDLLWLRVEIEESPHGLETLITR